MKKHRSCSAGIKQQLIDTGFDVPMLSSDGSWLFDGGTISGALLEGRPTANFISSPLLVEKGQQYHYCF